MSIIAKFARQSSLSSTKFVRLFSIKFSKSHEYCDKNGGIATIGITDHAAKALGDVVYVDLPEIGKKFSAG